MLGHGEETKPRNLWGRKRAEADTKSIENLFSEVTAKKKILKIWVFKHKKHLELQVKMTRKALSQDVL